jgi:aconitase A
MTQAAHAYASTRKTFKTASGRAGQYYSLPELAKTFPNVSRLPVSIRIVLESVLRNCDGKKVTAEHVKELANWKPKAARTDEIPFVVARVVLQDFTGVPLLADLAAMRSVAKGPGQGSEDDRAAGAGRPRRRSLDHDRPLRHEGLARSEHESWSSSATRSATSS